MMHERQRQTTVGMNRSSNILYLKMNLDWHTQAMSIQI